MVQQNASQWNPRLFWIQQTCLHFKSSFSQDVFLKWKWHTAMMPLTFSSHLLKAIILQRRLSSQQLQSASWTQQGSSCWFLFMRTSSYCSLVRRPSVMLLLSSNLGNITATYPSVEACAKKNECRSHSCGLVFF